MEISSVVNLSSAVEQTSVCDAKGDGRGASFADVLERAARVEARESVEPVDQAEPPAEVFEGAPAARLEDFVTNIEGGQRAIEARLAQGLDGGSLDQGELLEMQALLYAQSQRVELASKVASSVTGGVKQVMQTQV